MSKISNWLIEMEETTEEAFTESLDIFETSTSEETMMATILTYVKSKMTTVDESYVKEYFEENVDSWIYAINSKCI